jgi:two-component system, OmpR family, sensor kinase
VTLRLRLVAGLVALMAAGLAIFGVTTYELYSRSQYDQLSADLRSSVPLVAQELAQKAHVSLPPSAQPAAGTGAGTYGEGAYGEGAYGDAGVARVPPGGAVEGGPPRHGGGPGGPAVLVAPGTYGELVSKSGKALSSVQQVSSSPAPHLTPALLAGTDKAQLVHLGSVTGSTRWLTYVSPELAGGDRVIVAVPTTQVTRSLHFLVLIELLGAAGLLLALSTGAGLVLRRGLSPLERMSDTAKTIAGGDLDQRVPVPQSAQSTEVGQLAVAFNTMLDEIQQAFAGRDQTEDRLRQFLADASHELRTPLTSIQGFAELFRLGTEDARVGTATIMRRIEEEAARMKGLVEDLLLLARLDQVRQGEKVAVDLSVLAADACSDAIAVAPGRPVTLSAPQPVLVLGDEDHLRQALANLVTNALRHTPEGSAIEVSARAGDNGAVIEVRDHGPGLDGEALAHAFDRFWRKDPARSGAGAGLGLAIVAAVAAEHGGTVLATNAAGGGARFRICLGPAEGQEARPLSTRRVVAFAPGPRPSNLS